MGMGVSRLEQLFGKAGRLDGDKSARSRLSQFLNRKVADLLLAAQARAKADARDLIEARDPPITQGLQGSIQQIRKLDVALALGPIPGQPAELPPLEPDLTEKARQRLPEVVGVSVVRPAHTFPALDREVKNPETWHGQRAIEVSDPLLQVGSLPLPLGNRAGEGGIAFFRELLSGFFTFIS